MCLLTSDGGYDTAAEEDYLPDLKASRLRERLRRRSAF